MEYRFEFAPEMVAKANERHDWIAEHSPERAEEWYQRHHWTEDVNKEWSLRLSRGEE